MNLKSGLKLLSVALLVTAGCETKTDAPSAATANPPAVQAVPAPEQVRASVPATPPVTLPAGPTRQALAKAARAGRHAFVFCYGRDDEATRTARAGFEAAVAGLTDRGDAVFLDRRQDADADVVTEYKLRAAPVPLVLVLAPNGAVTGGYRAADATAEKLAAAVASPAKQACLRALQDRKLVLLCVQNGSTPEAAQALAGAEAFRHDKRFADSTQLLKVDPADGLEQKFLEELQVPGKPPSAVTVFLAPPGVLVGMFEGATEASMFVSALVKATSSAGGCGSSGCGPASAGCGPASAGCR